ncbi:hypothetical protein B0A50_03301 [Salinomyces thailandicus]|uniref:Methylated-DNA--protein-cysteine methyltransferase n=1 Tax=Salinomyces thailandicus TaxID=706561 RepID=A0A4U0U1S8_9PEZI|nr:hypothetical protein B0A50_03301 [Salinomyces thailandica]
MISQPGELPISQLQEIWTNLYKHRLPALAKARDSAQPLWPVHLDHCFARIVLDNAVGVDRPWTDVVKAPAVKNMSVVQLQAAIEMAEGLACGEADLAALDERSLGLRGKKGKKRGVEEVDGSNDVTSPRKRKGGAGAISSYFLPSPASPHQDSKQHVNSKPEPNPSEPPEGPAKQTCKNDTDDMTIPLHKIATSTLTPFRKQTLTLLCQIPRGRYSTYQALSDHIAKTSHKTCARAVGNAMRNNPFAPDVPCHRILAADGSLGGFGGHWGEEG